MTGGPGPVTNFPESPSFLGPGYNKDPIRLIYPTPARSKSETKYRIGKVF